MRFWLHRHPFVKLFLLGILALGLIECIVLTYYLSSWMTLPTL
jgi:hypothetical protein